MAKYDFSEIQAQAILDAAKTVRDLYSRPGRKMVEGKFGWLGESG